MKHFWNFASIAMDNLSDQWRKSDGKFGGGTTTLLVVQNLKV